MEQLFLGAACPILSPLEARRAEELVSEASDKTNEPFSRLESDIYNEIIYLFAKVWFIQGASSMFTQPVRSFCSEDPFGNFLFWVLERPVSATSVLGQQKPHRDLSLFSEILQCRGRVSCSKQSSTLCLYLFCSEEETSQILCTPVGCPCHFPTSTYSRFFSSRDTPEHLLIMQFTAHR